jgi:guanylate kinase
LSDPSVFDPYRATRATELLAPFLSPAPVLVVISGPSGVGKDSVVKRMHELNYPFHFVVTVTDRGIRPGEVNGVDYYFVSPAEFQRMLAADELLEHAIVYGQSKGVPRAHARRALASGTDVVMRLDVQGAANIRAKIPEAISIFMAPPSLDILVERLSRRGCDSPAQVRARLDTAIAELEQASAFDYVVVNYEGQLDRAAHQVAGIMAAEKCRVGRHPVVL